jgi:pyocin large subunit-like protein
MAKHFESHAAEFGFKTNAEYLAAAQKFFAGGEAETIMRGADKLFHDEARNEFGVLSDKGNIRTYFKPFEGRVYWDDILKGLK